MKRTAFTLIELIVAMAAAAVILAAVYGVFGKAVHLRDSTLARTRDARVHAHAASVIRSDLRNGLVSGGTLATSLEGSQQGKNGSFPGYLMLTTTTGADVNDVPDPDVQQVEYYIVPDETASDKSGILVRALTRILLAPTKENPPEDTLLTGVTAMEVSFYDGNSWQDSWQATTASSTSSTSGTSGASGASGAATTASPTVTLPQAVRVRIERSAASGDGHVPPPIEVIVPWTTVAVNAASTTSTSGTTK
jgi:type II secretion system protein J